MARTAVFLFMSPLCILSPRSRKGVNHFPDDAVYYNAKAEMMKNSKGFTLVELVMVVSIIAILTTLAVQRFGSMQKIAARKVSIANQQAVGRSVEAFIALNGARGLNRLDALVGYGASDASEGFHYGSPESLGIYCGPTDCGSLPDETVASANKGLSDGLRGVLCVYALSKAEAGALRDIGLEYVMRHETKAQGHSVDKGDDGAYVSDGCGLDPELSACVATTVTNGLACAAVSGRTEAGRAIYRDCGQDLIASDAGENYGEAEVLAEIEATGGPLLAFGVGPSCSLVGAASAGLDAAPYSEALQANCYRQYIVLFRVRTVGGVATAEFAGVLDPDGNTIRSARRLVRQ